MNHYVLPELEYNYGALEPHISGRIIELHYSRHHQAYVDGANKALEQLAEARQKGSLDTAGQIAQALAFNVSGHVLHSIYWRNMAPKAGGRPTGELAQLLDQHFGSFDSFRQQLTKTAAGILGSGWAALMWDTLSSQLVITQIHDHQSSTIQGAVPVLVLDVWEHAYYSAINARPGLTGIADVELCLPDQVIITTFCAGLLRVNCALHRPAR
jgi:Fe-Mn family superoxide dismutase